MREDQIDQAERIETLRNDLLVQQQQKQQREQGSTFLDQYHSDIGGRFGVIEHETVIGRASPPPPPLPASSPWSGAQPQPGIEPPTGYRIDAMPSELSADLAAAEHLGAPAAAVAPPSAVQASTLAGDVETSTGAPPFSEQTNE
jgi:hypothetical protein